MLLLASQLAWYHSVPEKSKVSRAQQLQEPELKLPICENEYLVLLFYETGMYEIGGMGGIVPMSWNTIQSWINLTERDLEVYEKMLIKEMSEAYVSEYNAGTDPNRTRPYVEFAEKISVDEVSKNAAAFKAALLATVAAQRI